MKKFILPSLFILCTFAATQSFASVDGHQYNQKNRIQNGVKTGELTKKEAKNLIHDQKHIKKLEHKYRANSNGTLNELERAKLKALQAKESHDIYNKKHNDSSR